MVYQVYTVTENDDISSLASKLGTTVDELKRINGITGDALIPGNLLVVPKIDDDLYYVYIVKQGDNLYNIARTYNQDIDVLYSINGIKKGDYIYPNQELLIPKSDVSAYLTKSNDTLSNVIDKTGVSVTDLLSQNKNLYLLPEQLIIYKRV